MFNPKKNLFWYQQGPKLAALLFWLLILGGYSWYARQNNLTTTNALQLLGNWLAATFYGPLLYIFLYTVRPLLFFPATLLTMLGGFLFGPIAGVLYTIIGSNASAMVAFGVGHYFGQGVLVGQENQNLLQRYAQRLRQSSFETVLLMRLLFLPYDLVNYVAGFLGIRWQPFLLATAIGSIPGTFSFVLLGTSFGSLAELLAGKVKLDPVTLVISVFLIVSSLALSRYLKGRDR